MNLSETLKKYIEDTGWRKDKFARKIGTSPAILYAVLGGNQLLPLKYWGKIIEETKGAVTLGMLLDHRFKLFEFLEVKEGKNACICEVKFKKQT